MNHGYCKNCWWFKFITNQEFAFGNDGRLQRVLRRGQCWMHDSDKGHYKETDENSYCPDYTNRKKKVAGMKSVDEFIKSLEHDRQD